MRENSARRDLPTRSGGFCFHYTTVSFIGVSTTQYQNYRGVHDAVALTGRCVSVFHEPIWSVSRGFGTVLLPRVRWFYERRVGKHSAASSSVLATRHVVCRWLIQRAIEMLAAKTRPTVS